MAVKVTHDGTDWREPAENCCICRQPTSYWYRTGDRNVALCQACAWKAATAALLSVNMPWIIEVVKEVTAKVVCAVCAVCD